ncbi:MAG: bifunctional DNA-formamidopyrimidine glycosylase/DNA-(apurinic or apyrimidinic site) lyase [Thermoflexus sp.]
MPELPEVETLVRELRPHLAGRRIEQVTLHWPGSVATPSPRMFIQRMKGRAIQEIRRRGKFLWFVLDEGAWLVHLKMTGRLFLLPAPEPDPHARADFALDDGRILRFHDLRKFGRLYWVADPGQILRNLGPEPLDPQFRPQDLAQQIAGRRGRLKALLLDQSIIAGIGNIYADEALWRARLHPMRSAASLTEGEIQRLWKGIRDALLAGLRHHGTTIQWYRRSEGESGEHQRYLRVYGRAGRPCFRCGTPIVRQVLQGRSVYFCPSCQR